MSTETAANYTKKDLRALGFTIKQIKSLTPDGRLVTKLVGRPCFTYSATLVASTLGAAPNAAPVVQAA
jgi:hypothetical protein